MKILIAAVLAAGVLTVLSACGRSQPQTTVSGDAPPPVSHTVFAPYVNDINKAKNVQNVVNEQKQALDKAINSQAGNSTSAPAAQSH